MIGGGGSLRLGRGVLANALASLTNPVLLLGGCLLIRAGVLVAVIATGRGREGGREEVVSE